MNKYVLIIVIVIINSCTLKGKLDVDILDSKINTTSFRDNEYHNNSFSIIRFRINNNTKYNYVLNNPYSILDSSFPNKYSALSLNNIIIKDSNDGTLPMELVDFSLSGKIVPYLKMKDTLMYNHYKKLGYDMNKISTLNKIEENLIFIKAGEVLYFETYFSLPFNTPSIFNTEKINVIKDKKYEVSLIFDFDSTNVKRNLTWSQLKSIEKNKYKFYNGKIKSNSVPLIF